MSPVSLVFHTIVTVKLISQMYFEQTHPFYDIWYPCINSWAPPHTFSSQPTQCNQIINYIYNFNITKWVGCSIPRSPWRRSQVCTYQNIIVQLLQINRFVFKHKLSLYIKWCRLFKSLVQTILSTIGKPNTIGKQNRSLLFKFPHCSYGLDHSKAKPTHRNPRWQPCWSDLVLSGCLNSEWHLNTEPFNIWTTLEPPLYLELFWLVSNVFLK